MSSVKCSSEFDYMRLPFVISNVVSIIENKKPKCNYYIVILDI